MRLWGDGWHCWQTPLGGIHLSEAKKRFLEGMLHPANVLMCPHTCVTNLPKPREVHPGGWANISKSHIFPLKSVYLTWNSVWIRTTFSVVNWPVAFLFRLDVAIYQLQNIYQHQTRSIRFFIFFFLACLELVICYIPFDKHRLYFIIQ